MLISPQTNKIVAIGLMSGTSLDGTDLAACSFEFNNSGWSYELLKAVTLPYPPVWEKKLKEAMLISACEVFELNAELGKLYGELILDFIKDISPVPQLIASHGHTLFHRPERGFTTQIGSGAHIAAITGIHTVCDFRSKDVALGGQGAPLVPVGDHYLFSDYDACLNLGGIANVSMMQQQRRIAFDICPVNMALNLLARREGKDYDAEGEMAAGGSVIPDLLKTLNHLPFYSQQGPKSLGREWFEKEFMPLMTEGETKDISRTVCEHIADQHAAALKTLPEKARILVTGGGAFHRFLIQRIAEKSQKEICVPVKELVQFKEAIVFAFLGVLNYLGRVNVFDSATGSVKQHVGGAFYRGD